MLRMQKRMNAKLSRETWALLIMIVIALMIMSVNEWSYQRSAKSRKMLVENTAARENINNLVQRLTDAESGQRGYFITGRDEFLVPYNLAAGEINRSLKLLKENYESDPAQRKIVEGIARLSTDMLAELAVLLRSRQNSAPDTRLEQMMLNRGKVAMDSIRADAKTLRDNEMSDLIRERERVQKTMDLTRVGVHVLTLFGVLGYAFFLNYIATFNAQRRQHALALERQRDQLELDVLRRTQELSELNLHLQTAREEERARVARELHDDLGALLTAAKFDTARLKRSLGTVEPDVQDRINHLNATINEGIALKRRIIEDLRPSALFNLGLIAALEIHARELESRSGLKLHLALDLQQALLSEEVKLTIYRLVQESFSNIAKHANATEVHLKLRVDDTHVIATVIDNGRGFDPAVMPKNSHGLTGMRYRVAAHGGEIWINSTIGSGTQIDAWLPISAAV